MSYIVHDQGEALGGGGGGEERERTPRVAAASVCGMDLDVLDGDARDACVTERAHTQHGATQCS